MSTADQYRSAERLVLEMASFGSGATRAMVEATGMADFVSNTPLQVLCLLDLEGPTRPSTVGSIVGLTSGGTTKLLDRMEDAGLIRRSYGVFDDRRGVEVALTPDGRTLLRAAARALVDHLSEASALVGSMARLLDELQAD